MLEAVQLLFLASLAGSVVWLVYLARQQDAAAETDRAGLDGRTPPLR